jgi:hypothetical protein
MLAKMQVFLIDNDDKVGYPNVHFSLYADCQIFTIVNNMNLVTYQTRHNEFVTSAVDMSGTFYHPNIVFQF